jgi:hypothetical protein
MHSKHHEPKEAAHGELAARADRKSQAGQEPPSPEGTSSRCRARSFSTNSEWRRSAQCLPTGIINRPPGHRPIGMSI